MEASRGRFHIIGNAYSIILPLSASEYQSLYGVNATRKINDDIYAGLEQLISIAEWPNYDKWTKSSGTFVYTPDNYIDMIYIVHRTWSNVGGMPAGGIACLDLSYSQGTNYTITNTSLIIHGIVNDVSPIGSGLRMTPGHWGGTPKYPMDLKGVVSFSGHEHGHYLYGTGHAPYGKMMGLGADFGLDEYLSPWESIKLGYMIPELVDFTNGFNYSIDDFTSRHSSNQGEVLQVPINGTNEFFLIANRQKISSYDKIMWGDTCHDNPYFDLGQQEYYSKGVYIYHTPSEYNWTPSMDQECADGLWNWQYVNNQAPDWDPTNYWLPYFIKTAPVFDFNDAGSWGLAARDGKSTFSNGHYKWFGVGKKQLNTGGTGTDRIYTNIEEPWTSRKWMGDRWDAWSVSYNEVFSPYSSPSTVNWDNQNSGIFIYLNSMSGNTANLEIYKDGEGGWNLDAILQATPPSKPMLFRPVEIANCNGTTGNPRIIWDNNLEPDMVRTQGISVAFKRYKIYRAMSTNENTAPNTYSYLDTYDDYSPDDTANYIDNNPYNGVLIGCGLGGSNNNTDFWRYKIAAVDKYDDQSVMSDFVSVKGNWVSEPDNKNLSNNKPVMFSLFQNYPNPFNPVTEISFDLPLSTFVILIVYNAIGKEVARLLNSEYKNAGSYSVGFNASNLSSGIYFYRIEAGEFTNTKKMVFIK